MIDKFLGLLIVILTVFWIWTELQEPKYKMHFLQGDKLDAYLNNLGDDSVFRKLNESDLFYRERAITFWAHEDDSEGNQEFDD